MNQAVSLPPAVIALDNILINVLSPLIYTVVSVFRPSAPLLLVPLMLFSIYYTCPCLPCCCSCCCCRHAIFIAAFVFVALVVAAAAVVVLLVAVVASALQNGPLHRCHRQRVGDYATIDYATIDYAAASWGARATRTSTPGAAAVADTVRAAGSPDHNRSSTSPRVLVRS
jgi:hypothetical protein